ncbi:MAG: alpha/beta hydrolase [Bacteroidota bacterium]
MTTVFRVLKWTGSILSILLLFVLTSGLLFRLFSPAPSPPGQLIEVEGTKLHLHATGKRNHLPTVIIEAGQALPTGHYHWLSEELKDSLRVIRYDRAGIGYSELGVSLRDPQTIARELHALLAAAGESPPYILAGHSFGGFFIRKFADLYPDEVSALVFIDASHPDQRERMGYGPPPDFTLLCNTLAILGDVGVLGLFDRLNGSILHVDDFPDEVNQSFYDYSLNGRYYRGYREETKANLACYAQARATKDFGDLPIRVFTAGLRYNGQPAKPEWLALQAELAALSTNGKHVIIPGHHNSIYTTRRNAEVICGEILALAKKTTPSQTLVVPR